VTTYATLAELKDAAILNLSSNQYDTLLSSYLETASRAIDNYCNRRFYQSATGVSRRYTARDRLTVFIDDLLSLTSLKTDDDGDGTFETTWDTSDYILQPLNGTPKLWIEVATQGGRLFPLWTGAVEVTGDFGHNATGSHPEPIKTACLMIAARLFRQGEAGFINRAGSVKYAPFVEEGRRPGKAPPVEALTGKPEHLDRWVRRKFGLRGDIARGVAFQIALLIARRGTRGAHMFRQAAEASVDRIVSIFRDAFRRVRV